MKTLLTTTALLLAVNAGMAQAAPDAPPPAPPPAVGDAPPPLPPHGGPGGPQRAHIHEIMQQFPEDKQKLLKNVFQESRQERQDQDSKIRSLHDEMRAVMTAQNFDKAKFLKVSKQIDDIHQTLHEHQLHRMADVATKLSASERQLLVQIMPPDMPPPPSPGGPGAPPPPPPGGPGAPPPPPPHEDEGL